MSHLNHFWASAIVCASLTLSASATTYYVSESGGSDNNNGLSQTTAFKTLSRVGALKKVTGGDSILLRRGDVWHEQLVVPGSGSSARSRLVIDAYGQGATPIIDGADPETGWSLISAGTYQTRRTIPSYKVFVDAIYAQAVPLKAQANLAVAINTPGSFYSDADTLYVHLIDGSNPSKHTIEVSGSGHQNGIVAINKSFVTIQNLEIIRTTNSGVAFVLDSPNTAGNGPNQNNTLQALTIFNTGSSAPMPFGFDGGIMVRANTSYGSMAVTGWTIAKNLVGRLDSPVGLNYNIAGINMRGIKGAYIANNAVRTTTAMGIQDRNYGLASSCGANLIANNSLSDNEGNISAEENYDYVNNNKISNSRGFGIQVQSFGYATNNLIAHLKTSTDGTLYNGIDGAGGANAVYGNNNVSDVSGCSLTIEGTATGVQVLGGTYDATKGGQCALYTTASAGHVAFDGRTTWITKTPDAFRYRMASAGDRQNRMTQAKFMAATSGQ